MPFCYFARFRIVPEKEDAFLAAVDEMLAAAARDPGTLDYKAFTGEDRYSYTFYESYIDAAADEKHRTTGETAEIIGRMVQCIDPSGFSQEFLTQVADMHSARAAASE
jgi:quinol monooxygenase YgiN